MIREKMGSKQERKWEGKQEGSDREMIRFNLGDIVKMRKPHPCGSDQWEITRTGMDFRIKCLGCGHQVMLPRPKFEKSVKAVVKSKGDAV